MGSVLVAYSRGVDSTFLLKVTRDVLGDRVLAVTAVSPTYTQEEYEVACDICRDFSVRHVTVNSDELSDQNFSGNPPHRCYYCKKELFSKLREIAKEEGIDQVLDASNADDCSDFRPGREAARELGVRSPLVEVGLHKEEIRVLSKGMGIPTWNKPAMACLASRFPYGEQITLDKLKRIEQAESYLRSMGFAQVRVRCYSDLARIEVTSDAVHRLTLPEHREKITARLRELGFVYVTVDLQGYRTGSMNDALSADVKARHLRKADCARSAPA
jgi:uncharacterized protein